MKELLRTALAGLLFAVVMLSALWTWLDSQGVMLTVKPQPTVVLLPNVAPSLTPTAITLSATATWTPPPVALVQEITPQNAIEQALRERSNTCREEHQEFFVEEAKKLNDDFEDSFSLALGTSRIALSPIVANMQGIQRKMGNLTFDLCSQPAHDSLASAYKQAVDMFLLFMQEKDSAKLNLYTAQLSLQIGTLFLEAYSRDIVGGILISDLHTANRIAQGEKAPEEFPYLQQLASLTDAERCSTLGRLSEVYVQASRAAFGKFPLAPGQSPDVVSEILANPCGKK